MRYANPNTKDSKVSFKEKYEIYWGQVGCTCRWRVFLRIFHLLMVKSLQKSLSPTKRC